jgi:hypothetical protein
MGDRSHKQTEEAGVGQIMKRIIKTVFFIVTVLIHSLAIFAAEQSSAMDAANKATLRDTLGIDFLTDMANYPLIKFMMKGRYDLIRTAFIRGVLKNKFPAATYLLMPANHYNFLPHFSVHRGHPDPSGNYWVSDTAGYALDSLLVLQNARGRFEGEPAPLMLYAQAKMFIDPNGVSLGDTLGIIYVHRWADSIWEQRAAIPIITDDSLLSGQPCETPSLPSFFTLGSCFEKGAWSHLVKYSFWNSGKATIYLEYLKCYDLQGLVLVETGLYDEIIADSLMRIPIDAPTKIYMGNSVK